MSTSASTVLDPVAQLLADVINGLTGLGLTAAVKGEKWEPEIGGLQLPCGVVGLPSFDREALDAPESQLNARDWFLSYPVEILVDLENPRRNSAKVAEIVEAFIKAIDTDTLTAQDGSILVARVTSTARPSSTSTSARPLLGYVVSVEVHKLV
jgi:hypothetical protein